MEPWGCKFSCWHAVCISPSTVCLDQDMQGTSVCLARSVPAMHDRLIQSNEAVVSLNAG